MIQAPSSVCWENQSTKPRPPSLIAVVVAVAVVVGGVAAAAGLGSFVPVVWLRQKKPKERVYFFAATARISPHNSRWLFITLARFSGANKTGQKRKQTNGTRREKESTLFPFSSRCLSMHQHAVTTFPSIKLLSWWATNFFHPEVYPMRVWKLNFCFDFWKPFSTPLVQYKHRVMKQVQS